MGSKASKQVQNPEKNTESKNREGDTFFVEGSTFFVLCDNGSVLEYSTSESKIIHNHGQISGDKQFSIHREIAKTPNNKL